MSNKLTEAQIYVGNVGETAENVGRVQLELLLKNGLQPSHHVLEIGCGALVAGKPIMAYLESARYVGIEPNVWLLDAALRSDSAAVALVNEKKPVFLVNEDFDATPAGRKFDYVISHSILSHAAAWQLPQFMSAVARCLAVDGTAVVSIRFSDEQGRLTGDSHDREWVYPGTSSFAPETAAAAAVSVGLACEWIREYRELMVKEAPSNFHDWIRLRHVAVIADRSDAPTEAR